MSTEARSVASTIRGFRTDAGVEVLAIDAAQMREVDRVCIEERGPNLLQMKEKCRKKPGGA